ncbi:hypothetical protein ACFV09_43195, partial [Streptomyces sp. NPDC059631]
MAYSVGSAGSGDHRFSPRCPIQRSKPAAVSISDVTPLAHEIHSLVRADELGRVVALLPEERPYPLASDRL